MLFTLAPRRLSVRIVAFGLTLGALAVGAGVAAALAPPALGAGAALGLAVVLVVAVHPPAGPYVLLATTPLLAGLDRGLVLPVLRPHEALAGLVGAGLVAHLALCAAGRTPARVRPVFRRLDLTILFLAVSGSVLPLAIMVARGRAIVADDLFYALQIWKYYGVFVILRVSVTTVEQVRRCLWIALGAAALVALVGIAQVLGAPGVSAITAHYDVESVNQRQLERGTSTLASSIAVGDVMVFSLAIAFGLLVRRDPRRTTLVALALLFVFGTVATGQFSSLVGLLVGGLALGWLTGRLGRTILSFVSVAGIAALILRPVIEARLRGFDGGRTLPHSWQTRLENINTYFLPVLRDDLNWLTGVRPLARIPGPPALGIEFVWIESGYVYLLWTGGIVFLAAFLWFARVALRSVLQTARKRSDAVGVAATASFTALVVTVVLMVLDPHVTLRGSADLSFSLLALATGIPFAAGGDRSPRGPPPGAQNPDWAQRRRDS